MILDMKCPHCARVFGLRSEELKRSLERKACVGCGKAVGMGVRHGRFAMVFLPIAAVSIVTGLSGPVAAGIAGGAAGLFSVGLKKG